MTDNGIVETATCINIAMAKDRESFYCTASIYNKEESLNTITCNKSPHNGRVL